MSGLADLVLVPEGGFPAQQQQQGQEQQQQPLAPHGQDDSADDVDVEALAFNTDGIVVFDGGNYSAGPEYIGARGLGSLVAGWQGCRTGIGGGCSVLILKSSGVCG